jgi:hypothetical protein
MPDRALSTTLDDSFERYLRTREKVAVATAEITDATQPANSSDSLNGPMARVAT